MEKVGKARKEYAETTSMAIDILRAAGVDRGISVLTGDKHGGLTVFALDADNKAVT